MQKGLKTITITALILTGSIYYIVHNYNQYKLSQIPLQTRTYYIEDLGLHMKIEKPRELRARISFSRDTIFGDDYIDCGYGPLLAPDIFIKGKDTILINNQSCHGVFPTVSSDKFKIILLNSDEYIDHNDTTRYDYMFYLYGDIKGFQVFNRKRNWQYIVIYDIDWNLEYEGLFRQDTVDKITQNHRKGYKLRNKHLN